MCLAFCPAADGCDAVLFQFGPWRSAPRAYVHSNHEKEDSVSTQNQTVDVLNSFLRGEISAVETYRQALEKVQQPQVQTQLKTCMQSHAQRVDALSAEIRTLGGSPATSSGVWGSFAKAVEAGAKTFGEKAAVAALEEGEDHGRNDYRREIEKLDTTARQFVQSKLIPEQQKTHDAMSALKKTLS
jgi:uncharacterized protein (TIGR02284 family)